MRERREEARQAAPSAAEPPEARAERFVPTQPGVSAQEALAAPLVPAGRTGAGELPAASELAELVAKGALPVLRLAKVAGPALRLGARRS